MDDNARKALIEERVARDGLIVKEWYDHDENGLTAKLGLYEVVSPEAEDDGIYEGDEGQLEANVVGAEKYGNVRVAYTFTPEGYDGGNEITDLTLLDPIT